MAFSAWNRRWMHCTALDTALRSDEALHVDTRFFRYVEEHFYTTWLSKSIQLYYELSNDALSDLSLPYVCWSYHYDQIYFFDTLPHWTKEIALERRQRIHSADDTHLGWWYCAEYYVIPHHYRWQHHMHVPSFWAEYESLRLLYSYRHLLCSRNILDFFANVSSRIIICHHGFCVRCLT